MRLPQLHGRVMIFALALLCSLPSSLFRCCEAFSPSTVSSAFWHRQPNVVFTSSFSTKNGSSSSNNNNNQGQFRPFTTSSRLQMVFSFDGVDVFFQTHRFAASFFVGGTQALLADGLAQSQDNRSSGLCLRRIISFGLYGGLYQGMANEWIFNTLLPVLCFHSKLLEALVAVFFFGSYVSLPIAYSIKGLVFGTGIVKGGLNKYWRDVSTNGLLTKFWSLWIPVNCINFCLVPSQYRVAVNSVVAFGWLILFSTISSSTTPTGSATTTTKVLHHNHHHKSHPATVVVPVRNLALVRALGTGKTKLAHSQSLSVGKRTMN